MALAVVNDTPIIQHPINAFPEKLQDVINHYCEAKGYPHEYFITACVAAFSTALGRSVTMYTGNYSCIGSVWAIILGKKGFTKSEPLDDAFKPIRNFQFKLLSQYDSEVDEVEEMRANNPKLKIKDPKPCKKVILSDSTPEALVIALADNQKGCGIVYDELAGFVGRFNRYNSGADEQMYLSIFNGGSIMRERVKASSNAYAKSSYLSIVGTIQPSVLKEVFFNKSESGFFDRWLITNPENVKKQYPNSFGIDPVQEQRYSLMLEMLLDIGFEEEHFHQMRYTSESFKIINNYQREIIDIENETQDDNYRGILAKMEIYLHKFALILQMIEYSISGDFNDIYNVSEKSAEGAIILTKYYTSEAQKVRLLSPIEMLKDQWVQIYEALPDHGKSFDRIHFIKVCNKFGIAQRRADNFLKDNSDRTETKLFFKVKHGEYNKNLF